MNMTENQLFALSSSPHVRTKNTTSVIMRDVLIALAPAFVWSVIVFGYKAFVLTALSVALCVFFEAGYQKLTKKPVTVSDLSAAITGVLIAFNLPSSCAWWVLIPGTFFAIVIVKQLFGGIGKNIVNPAITARVFMLLTFGAVGAVALPTVVEITSGATPLAALNQGAEIAANEAPSLIDLFLGLHGGAIGETCALALIIGFIYLVVRKVIQWYVPTAFVATTFLCYFLFGGFDVVFALQHVLAGGLLLGAIFMATDYVTTPNTGKGRVVFCIGAGLLTFAIRQFGMFPEGVSIAILTMNLLTPFISDLTKRKTLGGVK